MGRIVWGEGVSAVAVTAMDAATVRGFTPSGFLAMSKHVRNRVNGARLSMLNRLGGESWNALTIKFEVLPVLCDVVRVSYSF